MQLLTCFSLASSTCFSQLSIPKTETLTEATIIDMVKTLKALKQTNTQTPISNDKATSESPIK